VLSAGERRSSTANTIIRDPAWRKRDPQGALRISPADAAALGLATGGHARIVTAAGSAESVVEVTDAMLPGHVSLPNGQGIEYPGEDGQPVLTGVAANELTSLEWRDPLAGTPWHKHVPARVEAV
jgi:formate dehydrogenase